MKSIVLIALSISFTILAFAASPVAYAARISGRVISKATQQPLTGVTVRVVGTNYGAITKQDGTFAIENVPPGIYSIQFSSIAFETYIEANAAVTAAKPYEIETALIDRVIRLEGAEVRSTYFEKRIETSASAQSLSAEDIRRAPGVQEDVVRATALLPGVGVTQAGRNDLVVRGGAPFENLFIVDNLEVPNINHFGTQGSGGGPLTIVNIDFVKNVDFSAGAFGARYGDKVSSITNIQLRNGNEEEFGGKLNLSATGFGLNLEGPISNKGSYLMSVRRSYLDFIFKAAGFSFIPQYWDFQGKVNYKLNETNTLSFLVIGAINTVSLNNETEDDRFDNSRVAVPQQNQYFSGITWRNIFKNGFVTVTLGETYSKYSVSQSDSLLVEIFKNNSKESETILRADFDLQLPNSWYLTFGNQTKWTTTLDYSILIPGEYRRDFKGDLRPLNVDTSFSAIRNATYLAMNKSIGRFKITGGLRAEIANFISSDAIFVSPRASAAYQVNELSTLTISGGRYYQYPSYVWLMGDPMNARLKPIRADQVVLSYEYIPLPDVKTQVEVYKKIYRDYPARLLRPWGMLAPTGFEDLQSDIPYGLEPLMSKGVGNSMGIEFFIQKKLSEIPIYGLMSLTISKTEFRGLNYEYALSAYDSPVIFNIAAGWRIDQDWEVSSKFRAATGAPTTPFDEVNKRFDYARYNQGERLPTFHAMDVRIDKRWNFYNSILVTYVDVQNVYGRKNVSSVRYNPRTENIEYQKSIGILPSVGISWEF
ncbi:MAG: TonB-dependent receptor [Chloroflexota bacterium]